MKPIDLPSAAFMARFKPTAAPENSLDLASTWAWTSMPMTISQSPVAPLIQSFFSATRFADSNMLLTSGLAPW